MLLRCGLINWCARDLGVAAADILGLPDEVLKQVALVLGEEKKFGLFDDFSEVCYKLLSV